MVRASDRCTEGHGFDSRRGIRFLFCPTLATCWIFHLFLKRVTLLDTLHNFDEFLETTVPHTLIQNGYWLLNTLDFHEGILTCCKWRRPYNSSMWKGKDVKECFKLDDAYRGNWRAWREEIFVRGHTFFQRRFAKQPSAKNHSSSNLSFRSKYFSVHLNEYTPYLIVDLRPKDCLIERVYVFTIIFLTLLKNL